MKSLKRAGADVSDHMVQKALRDRVQGDPCVSQLIHLLSLLPGLVDAIGKSLPECVVDFATKPLAPEVMAAVPQSVRSCARAFQHFFFCEGDIRFGEM